MSFEPEALTNQYFQHFIQQIEQNICSHLKTKISQEIKKVRKSFYWNTKNKVRCLITICGNHIYSCWDFYASIFFYIFFNQYIYD